jgi:hypothetical protein
MLGPTESVSLSSSEITPNKVRKGLRELTYMAAKCMLVDPRQ